MGYFPSTRELEPVHNLTFIEGESRSLTDPQPMKRSVSNGRPVRALSRKHRSLLQPYDVLVRAAYWRLRDRYSRLHGTKPFFIYPQSEKEKKRRRRNMEKRGSKAQSWIGESGVGKWLGGGGRIEGREMGV